MKITKAELTNKIHNRLDSELSKQIIEDAISVISMELISILLEQESLSIDNFGTLHSYFLSGHSGVDIYTGELQYVQPKKSIKFSPHITFSSILNEKKDRFKKK